MLSFLGKTVATVTIYAAMLVWVATFRLVSSGPFAIAAILAAGWLGLDPLVGTGAAFGLVVYSLSGLRNAHQSETSSTLVKGMLAWFQLAVIRKYDLVLTPERVAKCNAEYEAWAGLPFGAE